MTEGDIVLIHLPQANGTSKLRPALLLKQLPNTMIIWLVGYHPNCTNI